MQCVKIIKIAEISTYFEVCRNVIYNKSVLSYDYIFKHFEPTLGGHNTNQIEKGTQEKGTFRAPEKLLYRKNAFTAICLYSKL